MRILTFAAVVAIALGLMSGAASAHTLSIGTFNAGAPGSVTIVMGTYDHSMFGGNFTQGSIALVAGPSAPAGPVAFGSLTFVKPAALVDGVNNFFAPAIGGAVGQYDQNSNTTTETEHNWQSATFFGLAPGLYTYSISGMTDVNWADWNSGNANWRGTLLIPDSSTAPEPASLLLLGLGVAGFAAIRRRRRA